MGLINMNFFLDASGKFKKFIGMHHKDEPDELHAAAAAVNGALQRQNSTHIPFFLTKSQKEWAKVCRTAYFEDILTICSTPSAPLIAPLFLNGWRVGASLLMNNRK
jgi:hypothetical protein